MLPVNVLYLIIPSELTTNNTFVQFLVLWLGLLPPGVGNLKDEHRVYLFVAQDFSPENASKSKYFQND